MSNSLIYKEPFSEEEIAEHKDYCLNAIFSDKTDFNRVEKAIENLYSQLDLNKPEIIYCKSPKEFFDRSSSLSENRLDNQIWAQIRNQIWNQVQNQVTNQVQNQVLTQVRYQVTEQIWDQVWGQIRAQALNQVYNQVRNQVMNQIWALSFSIFKKLPEISKLKHLIELAESIDIIQLLTEKYAYISEKPVKILKRNDHYIHIEYSDDYAISELSPLEQLALQVTQ